MMFAEVNNRLINIEFIETIYIHKKECKRLNATISSYPVFDHYEYELIISGQGFSEVMLSSRDETEVIKKYEAVKEKLKHAHIVMRFEEE